MTFAVELTRDGGRSNSITKLTGRPPAIAGRTHRQPDCGPAGDPDTGPSSGERAPDRLRCETHSPDCARSAAAPGRGPASPGIAPPCWRRSLATRAAALRAEGGA